MSYKHDNRDANEREIQQALENLGALVIPIRARQAGIPDLIAGFNGKFVLIEVKDGKGGRVSKAQREFHALCEYRGLPCYLVRSVPDAIRIVQELGSLGA